MKRSPQWPSRVLIAAALVAVGGLVLFLTGSKAHWSDSLTGMQQVETNGSQAQHVTYHGASGIDLTLPDSWLVLDCSPLPQLHLFADPTHAGLCETPLGLATISFIGPVYNTTESEPTYPAGGENVVVAGYRATKYSNLMFGQQLTTVYVVHPSVDTWMLIYVPQPQPERVLQVLGSMVVTPD